MKKSSNKQKTFLLVSALFLVLVLSCATTGGLITSPARVGDLGTGPFTAIFYSTAEHNSLQTVVFLDLEGDAYELQPFGAPFNYSLVKGLSGVDADRRAREFIASHVLYNKIELRAIKGPEGIPVGYELRPLQLPITYGESDVLDITYIPRQNEKIIVYVQLKDRIERKFEREM